MYKVYMYNVSWKFIFLKGGLIFEQLTLLKNTSSVENINLFNNSVTFTVQILQSATLDEMREETNICGNVSARNFFFQIFYFLFHNIWNKMPYGVKQVCWKRHRIFILIDSTQCSNCKITDFWLRTNS